MKNIIIFTAAIILTSLLFSCNYHNKEKYFNDTCDTIEISFVNDINPIIQNYCISCHNSEENYKERIYETYEGVKEVAANGLMLKVINHESGVEGMPFQASKLPQCEINKIEAWINQGTKNN